MARKREIAPKSKRGGRRAGAGRKSSAVKKLREEILADVDRLILDRLDQPIEKLFILANGGLVRDKAKRVPAGELLIDDVVRNPDGTVVFDANGKLTKIKTLKYPDRPADELVLVEITTEVAEPDREACKYLIDRVMGRPKQSVEASGPDGQPIPIRLEQAIDRAYGDAGGGGS